MTTTDIITSYFQNVLQRDPSPEALDQLVSTVESGTWTLAEARASIINSAEAQLNVVAVIRLYQAAFGREPDQAGLAVNVDALRNGLKLEQLAEAFVVSPEFVARFGGSTQVDSQILRSIYQDILCRPGDTAELTHWQSSELTLAQILVGISESPEARAKTNSPINTFLEEAALGDQNFTGPLICGPDETTTPDVPTPDVPTPGGQPVNTTFTANKNGFDTNNTADSNEQISTSGVDNTINATLTQITGATIQGLGGTDTLNISSAGVADLTGVTTLDTIDTLRLLDAGASLQIGTARDSDNFGALVGAGTNDLIVAAGGNTNLASFEGFDMIDATGLADDEVLTVTDTSTGTNYTVNLGNSDLAAGTSTSTDTITVVQGSPGATQSIVTGAGNDDITATGATVLTIDAGFGHDTVSVGGNVRNSDTIAGGVGIDTLNISDSATSPQIRIDTFQNITGFEIVNIDANFSNSPIVGDSIVLNDVDLETDITVNVTGTAGIIDVNASNISSQKLIYNGSDVIDGVAGTQLGDVIDLGEGQDFVKTTTGSDRITLGGGRDTYDAARNGQNVFLSGTDVITDFVQASAPGSRDQIRLNLSDAGQITTNNEIASLVNADARGVVILQSGQTSTQIETATSVGSVGNAVIAVYNSTTDQAELWFDTNWNNTANRQHFLTLEGIDLVGVQSFSTVNGTDFNVA